MSMQRASALSTPQYSADAQCMGTIQRAIAKVGSLTSRYFTDICGSPTTPQSADEFCCMVITDYVLCSSYAACLITGNLPINITTLAQGILCCTSVAALRIEQE